MSLTGDRIIVLSASWQVSLWLGAATGLINYHSRCMIERGRRERHSMHTPVPKVGRVLHPITKLSLASLPIN